MARSNGPCHSLTIKLGQARKELDRMQKQLELERSARAASNGVAKETSAQEIKALKGQLEGVCGLRDLIVRYDDLALALSPATLYSTPTQKCLATLRTSLFEAAEGLGVKRV